jgi:two-component system, chemotaxis family, protein-glutamate methylesterase/glutaminase
MSYSERVRHARTVLIVDDSALMRTLLREHVTQGSRYEVVGEAASGYEAIRMVHELDPGVLTLDLEMLDLGGLDVLRYIMSESPRPVVIVSSRSDRLADPALQAMLLGAVEFVPKPASPSEEDVRQFRRRLTLALHAAAMARLLNIPQRLQQAAQRVPAPAGAPPARAAIAIAASTGGPRALAELVPLLPAGLPAAVLIVQHMPPTFTAALARRLNDAGPLPAREAVDGEVLREGVVYVARGGVHLDVERGGSGVVVRLTEAAPVWGVRPAADVLFAAIARSFGPASAGIVLTGMGRDGTEGLRALREVGAATFVQDEASCLIPSMPRSAAPHAQCALAPAGLAAAAAEWALRQRRPA